MARKIFNRPGLSLCNRHRPRRARPFSEPSRRTPTSKHMAAITDPKEIGGLLRAIDDYNGSIVTRCALKLAPLVFVRPGELRQAEWKEINLETAEWRIPPEKMKAKVLHIVPLSTQAVAVLREILPLTGQGRYVFPSPRTSKRPMSNNAVLAALRRMGYTKEEMTGHGFRSMASTLLNEQGWNRDAIERQLAQAERNSVRAAYNYAEFLPIRREMMQSWADLPGSFKNGGDRPGCTYQSCGVKQPDILKIKTQPHEIFDTLRSSH